MRFSFGYDEEDAWCMELKLVLERQIDLLMEKGVCLFYSGMSQGIDLWCAEIILDRKKRQPHIRLHAAIPCQEQANKWSAQQRERYFGILEGCDEVATMQAYYTSACMAQRNRYLIDHAAYLLAVYDGAPKGGISYAVRYAEALGREIIFIHPDTLEIVSKADLEALERRKQLRILPGRQGHR